LDISFGKHLPNAGYTDGETVFINITPKSFLNDTVLVKDLRTNVLYNIDIVDLLSVIFEHEQIEKIVIRENLDLPKDMHYILQLLEFEGKLYNVECLMEK